jgi:hypothetical protein
MVTVRGFTEGAQCAVGVGSHPDAVDMCTERSCPTRTRNSANAFLLGQSGAISRLHGFWDSFVCSSCLCSLSNTQKYNQYHLPHTEWRTKCHTIRILIHAISFYGDF